MLHFEVPVNHNEERMSPTYHDPSENSVKSKQKLDEVKQELNAGKEYKSLNDYSHKRGFSSNQSPVSENFPSILLESEYELNKSQEMKARASIIESLNAQSEKISKLNEAIKILSLDLEEKALKKEEIQKKYDEDLICLMKNESEIKKDLDELSEAIESLHLMRNREKQAESLEIKKLNEKIKNQKKDLDNALSVYNNFKTTIDGIKKEANENYNNRLNKFRESLEPMEDASHKIQERKKDSIEVLKEAESKYQTTWNRLGILIEDYNARKLWLEEANKRKDELEDLHRKYQGENNEAAKLFLFELEIDEKLKNCQAKEKEVQKTAIIIDKEISEVAQKISEIQLKILNLKQLSDSNSAIIPQIASKNIETIDEIEVIINNSLKKLVGLDLISLVNLLIEKTESNPELNITSLQLQKLRSSKELIKQENVNEENSIKEKIQDIKKEIDAISTRKEFSEDSLEYHQGLVKIKNFEEKIKELNEELNEVLKFRDYKISLIDDYISSHSSLLLIHPKQYLQECLEKLNKIDLEILIISYLKEKLPNKENEINNFSTTLTNYMSLVNERENSIQKIFLNDQIHKSQVSELQIKREEYNSALQNLINERREISKEISQCQEEEKSITKLIEDNKIKNDKYLESFSERQFSKFMKENSDLLKEIRKSKGINAARKAEEEYKKEFNLANSSSQMDIKLKVEKVFYDLKAINEAINNYHSVINTKLVSEINDEKKSTSEQGLYFTKAQNELSIILNAEDEITKRTLDFLQRKKEELNTLIETVYRKKNMEFFVKSAEEARIEWENKMKGLEDFKVERENIHKLISDKIMEYSIKKAKLKMRYDVNQLQISKIENDLRPRLKGLSNDLKNYSTCIYNMKKDREIMEERLVNNQAGFESSKQILTEKEKIFDSFHSNPQVKGYQSTKNQDINVSREEELKKQMKEKDLRFGLENRFIEIISPLNKASDSPSKYATINVIEYQLTEDDKIKNEEYSYSNDNPSKSKYKIKLIKCTIKEIELYNSIKYFLDGILLLKKNTKINLPKNTFDPLDFTKPPEQCGFTLRKIVYNITENKLEFFKGNSQFAESSILFKDAKSVVIPSLTSLIIKAQRIVGHSSSSEIDKNIDFQGQIDKIDRNMNNEMFRRKSKLVKYYEFGLLSKDLKYEFAVEGLDKFNYIVNGIMKLIESQSFINLLNNKLEQVSISEANPSN